MLDANGPAGGGQLAAAAKAALKRKNECLIFRMRAQNFNNSNSTARIEGFSFFSFGDICLIFILREIMGVRMVFQIS